MDKTVVLKNVRLSFADIWQPKAFNPGSPLKYSCNFLLDKETQGDQIKALEKKMQEMALDFFNGKPPKGIKRCLGDGEEKSYEGYEGQMFVSASTVRKPEIIDRDKMELVELDDKPYSGCYVNAVIGLWVQDNQYGKRVNANLDLIQFVKEGDRFGGGGGSKADLLDDIGDEAAADVVAEAEDSFFE